MRKLKTFQVFLEDKESDESLVRLDSVGCVLDEYSGWLWPEMRDGSVDWEGGVEWEETDWSFRQEMSTEDRATVDATMVSAEEYFGGRVDMSLIDYLSDVLVAEELTDNGYQVRIQAAVWNWVGGQKYMSSHASLPTVFMRVQEEGRTQDDWIRDFKRSMENLDADFSKYGIAYVVTFHMRGDSINASQVKIPDDVAEVVKERVSAEFPDAHLEVRQGVRWVS